MLRTRIVTAVALLVVLLPALFWSPLAWSVATLAFVAAAAWEWTRLLEQPQRAWPVAVIAAAAGAAALVWRSHSGGWPTGLLAALAGVALLFWVLGAPRALASLQARRGGLLTAAVLLAAAWVALIELRAQGSLMLLSSMALVWVADVGAYAVGRAVGRRKLAPRVSPGKSWEGAIGAAVIVAVAVVVVAVVWPQADTLPALMARQVSWPVVVALAVVLSALSVVGDLYESLLKRQAGVKDSGKTLPGHGGVLDRVDALLPVMPAALLLTLALR